MRGVRVCYLSYEQQAGLAAARARRGERQVLRKKCGYYHWPKEKCAGHAPVRKGGSR